MPIDWSRLTELVAKSGRILLTSHMRPDCDALGSELGMAGVLESLGKEVLIVNADPTPPHLRFIDPDNRIMVLGRDVQPDELSAIDLAIVLDTSAWAQLGPMGDVLRTLKSHKLVIDHHVSEDDLGAEPLKNPKAEATGRLVVEAADALGVALTPRIAVPLFTAVATDTGWFRFASVTGDTFRLVGRLVDAGARPDVIYAALYERDTMGRVLLRGRIIAAAQTEFDGRLIYSQVERADFEATGAEPSDTEDVINMLLQLAGSEVALLFVEQDDGRVKASFRSRSRIDVRQVAEQFGGGGHLAAAGAMLDEPLPAARQKILDAVRKVMR